MIQKSKTETDAGGPDGWNPLDKFGTNLWADTLDVMEEPVIFFRSDGTVFHTNPAALSFYGVKEADLLGMHCYEMVRRFGLRFTECPYERVMKTKKPESGMVEHEGVWHAHRVYPVPGSAGDVEGMLSVIRDGNESVHLHTVSEQLQMLMSATDNAVMITGPDHRIAQWNSGVSRAFGYQADDLDGTLIHDLVPLTFRKTFEEYADRVMEGEIIPEFFMPGLTKGGEVMDVAVSMAPLHDPGGTVSGMMALSRDVTGEHDVDMRLVQHLSDTSERINGPLSHMRSNLEETVAALQDGLMTTEDLVMFLTLLMKSVGNIEESLKEMNSVAIEGLDTLPEGFRKYLAK